MYQQVVLGEHGRMTASTMRYVGPALVIARGNELELGMREHDAVLRERGRARRVRVVEASPHPLDRARLWRRARLSRTASASRVPLGTLVALGASGELVASIEEAPPRVSADELICRSAPLPPEPALVVVRAMADALAALEAHACCPLLVRPDTVHVAHDGAVRITLLPARDPRADVRDAPMDRHDVAWVAPECCRGHEPDLRAAMCSLGMALVELCAGPVVERSTMMEHIRARAYGESPLELLRDRAVPDALRLVIARCTSVERGSRLSSFAELRAHLDSLGATDPRATRELAELVRVGFPAALRELSTPELPADVAAPEGVYTEVEVPPYPALAH